MDDFEHEITYDVREDGVLYHLRDAIDVLIKRKGQDSQQVAVEMWRGESLLPPQKGDLDSAAFRERLAKLARDRFNVEAKFLAEELGWIAARYVRHAEERYRELRKDYEGTKPEEFIGTQYSISNGGFVRELNARQMLSAMLSGADPFTRMTNFVAEILEEVTVDDGAEVRRHYRIRGSVEGRINLPEVVVPANQLAGMTWVTEHWGVAANIAAGLGTKDQVREAIQLYSRGAPQRFVYQHTGFRERGEKRIYLHAGGAIGLEGIEVELQDKLDRYALPHYVNEHELAAAVKRSLSILDVAPDCVTVPALALAYLSVLSEIVPPDFTFWLWGATGNLKSSFAAVVLSHFGNFSEDDMPLEFTATANYIERVLFLLKDTLVVVDDWRPAVSRSDAAEQDRKAQRLLRAVGNRAGRGRMRSDTSLRPTYIPRGGVIATAESIPEGPAFESATARALTVNLARENVDLPLLTKLQAAENKPELAIAMHGFISWVASNYDSYRALLPQKRREYREHFAAKLVGSHPRTPTMAAALMVGFRMLITFAGDAGSIASDAEYTEMLERGERAIIEACKRHTEATRGDDAATRFCEMLGSLFDANTVYVKDREDGGHPDDWAELGWERRDTQDEEEIVPGKRARFVGWVDKEFLYLDKDAAYAAVAEFAVRGGIPFGIKPRSLWQALKRCGVSVCAPSRTDTTARTEGKTRRVVQIPKPRILGGDDDHLWE